MSENKKKKRAIKFALTYFSQTKKQIKKKLFKKYPLTLKICPELNNKIYLILRNFHLFNF